MPLNRSNKIDRSYLPTELEALIDRLNDEGAKSPEKSSASMGMRPEEPPTPEVSKVILASFSRVMKRELAPLSSFISQGGDSISAMRMVGACRKKGVHLSVKDILTAERLEHLARLLRSKSGAVER